MPESVQSVLNFPYICLHSEHCYFKLVKMASKTVIRPIEIELFLHIRPFRQPYDVLKSNLCSGGLKILSGHLLSFFPIILFYHVD